VESEPTTSADEFAKYDTPEHRAAQGQCVCIIHHAIDAETRRGVSQNLDNARRTSDTPGLILAMVQLTGACPHRPAEPGQDAGRG
jgi:hypothetical protein